jgi:Flp pilus assembly protein TadD
VLRAGGFLLFLFSAYNLGAEDAQALLGEGLAYLEHARYGEAIEVLERAALLDPTLALARYDLGICYFVQGRFEAAQHAFEDAQHLNPHHRFTVYYLARLDLLNGNLDAAIRGFRSLAGGEPVADEFYYLGSAYFRQGDLEPAIRSLRKAVALKPADSRAYFLLARVYQKAGREAEAKQQFALSEQVRNADQQKARDMVACNVALDSQYRDLALTRCRELLDGSDPIKLVSLGMAMAQRQLYTSAIEPFQRAARLDPDNFEPTYNLGLTYFHLKDYAAARAPLETAVGLRPEYFDAVALLASTLFALGDDENALGHLRHAHRLKPADEKIKALLLQELTVTARHFETGGDRPQAHALFEEVRSLQSEAPRN